MQFSLKGQGNSKELEFDPPLLFFEEELLITKMYSHTIKLAKKSTGKFIYTFRLDGKNDDSFEVSVIN